MKKRSRGDKERIRALYARDASDRKDFLDELWREYRICKQYGSCGEMLDRLAAFKCDTKSYNVQISWQNDLPPNGAPYWMETIDRPVKWTEHEVY